MAQRSLLRNLVAGKRKMEPANLNSKQIHVLFSGHVQGVGFRWTTHKIANELQLKGWVKNLANGKVELIAEGPTDILQRLITRLNNRFEISSVEMREFPQTGEFRSFEIIR